VLSSDDIIHIQPAIGINVLMTDILYSSRFLHVGKFWRTTGLMKFIIAWLEKSSDTTSESDRFVSEEQMQM